MHRFLRKEPLIFSATRLLTSFKTKNKPDYVRYSSGSSNEFLPRPSECKPDRNPAWNPAWQMPTVISKVNSNLKAF